MKAKMIPGVTTPLPPPPTGWFDCTYAALCTGELVLVRADRDFHAEFAHWLAQSRRGDFTTHRPDLRDARLRLSRFDGNAEGEAIIVPGCNWPQIDRFPNGQWLVVASRSAPGEDNARLYSADGVPAGTFVAGDGIEHVQCAEDGTVWMGYFDEGVYSGHHADGTPSVSSSGIAHFSPTGEVLWKFNDQAPDGCHIDDCYALTLDGSTPWSCSYTKFHIVRIDGTAVKSWRNRVSGASALAIDADHVLLAGGYDGQSERIALLRLGDNHAKQLREWRFQRMDHNSACLLQGRGDTLHVVDQGMWTKISVAMLRAESRRD